MNCLHLYVYGSVLYLCVYDEFRTVSGCLRRAPYCIGVLTTGSSLPLFIRGGGLRKQDGGVDNPSVTHGDSSLYTR
ncbi:MAG: hypothetical protein J6S04_00225, partial [Clostridia bacterium]|nr:hypothetical protein [Clostridia bacterium]